MSLTHNSNCWDQIMLKMNIASLDEIKTIQSILDFMGFKTIQSLAKLNKKSELDRFEIGVGKLSGNVRFCEKYPELKGWNLDQGDLLVVKDISGAAIASLTHNNDQHVDIVQLNVYNRCKKVADQLNLSHVLVSLDFSPKCDVICPKCNFVSKLALIKQADFSAPPKFNSFNFERHYTVSCPKKVRRALENVTNTREMIDDVTGFYSPNLSIELFSAESVTTKRKQNIQFTSTPKRVCLPSITSSAHSSTSTSKDFELEQMKNRNRELEIQVEKYCEEIQEMNAKWIQKESDFQSLQQQPQPADIHQLNSKIQTLENENASLQQQQIVLRHKVMDMRGTIRGFLRLKPTDQPRIGWSVGADKTHLRFGDENSNGQYFLDYIFEPHKTNSEVFDLIQPLIAGTANGISACIIAYGGSGSGKTHSMSGSQDDVGILPRSIQLLTDNMKDGAITISFFEIYNDNIVDLLKSSDELDVTLKILDSQVRNLVKRRIESAEHFAKIIAEATNNRTSASTHRNQGSSRSHAILQVNLRGEYNGKTFESELILVDLAGTENSNDHFDGTDKIKRAAELANINKSVSALRTMLESMKKKENVDFRSCKLTHVLKRYFTTDYKILFLATVSQESKYFATSKETLALVKSAMEIKIK